VNNQDKRLGDYFTSARVYKTAEDEQALELQYQKIDEESIYAEGGDIEDFLVAQNLSKIEVSPHYEEQVVVLVGDFYPVIYKDK